MLLKPKHIPALLIVVSLFLAGCGTDEFEADDVSVNKTPPAPAPATTVDVTPAPEPEVVAEIAPEPEEPREVSYTEAESAYLDRRYDDAQTMFALYTTRENNNPWGFYMLGLSAWKAGDFETAEFAFEEALTLDAVHFKSYINLSRVLLDSGRPIEALDQLDHALEIDAESGVAYRLRGRAFYQLQQSEDAVGAYHKAIQLDNEDAWSMNNLGLILIEDGRFEDALEPLARAVELRTDVAVFYNNLGMALESTGHFRAAEEAYQAAVAIDGYHEKAVNNLDRVTAVVEDPLVEPVDLAAAAERFVETIAGWGNTSVAVVDEPETTEPVVGEPDTSSSDQ